MNIPIETKDDLKTAVLSNLNFGHNHALTGKVLRQRLGLKDTRQIRLAIVDLIEYNQVPIVFSGKGYYIAETPEECAEALLKLRAYIIMLAKHRKYLKLASQKKFSGQMALIL